MFKLIRLEWKKNNVKKVIISALIMTVILAIFVLLLAFFATVSGEGVGAANGLVTTLVEIPTGMSFVVFTSTLFGSFIVSTYKSKTMALMFSYPIKRKKILLSQMLAVWILGFVFLVVSRLLIYSCILIGLNFFTSQFLIEIDFTSLDLFGN